MATDFNSKLLNIIFENYSGLNEYNIIDYGSSTGKNANDRIKSIIDMINDNNQLKKKIQFNVLFNDRPENKWDKLELLLNDDENSIKKIDNVDCMRLERNDPIFIK